MAFAAEWSPRRGLPYFISGDFPMHRLFFLTGAVLIAAIPQQLCAEAFDYYINPVISRVAGKEGVQEVKQLTPALIADNDRVIPEASAALIVVCTNDSRYSKLMV